MASAQGGKVMEKHASNRERNGDSTAEHVLSSTVNILTTSTQILILF